MARVSEIVPVNVVLRTNNILRVSRGFMELSKYGKLIFGSSAVALKKKKETPRPPVLLWLFHGNPVQAGRSPRVLSY